VKREAACSWAGEKKKTSSWEKRNGTPSVPLRLGDKKESRGDNRQKGKGKEAHEEVGQAVKSARGDASPPCPEKGEEGIGSDLIVEKGKRKIGNCFVIGKTNAESGEKAVSPEEKRRRPWSCPLMKD